MRTYNLKTGDTKPMPATLSYVDGSPIDLTGATVTFYMGTTIPGGTVTVLDAVNGGVEYPWQAGETDTPGTFDAEFKVVKSGTSVRVPSKGTMKISITAAVPG